MADTAARLALVVRRYELARFTIAVTGIDMTGVDMKMQVRLQRGTPGAPLIQLAKVNSSGAEGLKLDSVTVTNGVPTSIIKGRINASTMNDASKVPFAGELGADTVLAYAIQWTINGDAQTRLMGEFIVQDQAYGSDAAPGDRPPGYTTSHHGGASFGSLQFGDQVVSVTIGDAALIGAIAAGATLAKAGAEVALAKSRDWAESAKTHALDAASASGAAAQQAADAGAAYDGIRTLTGNAPVTEPLQVRASSRAVAKGYIGMVAGLTIALFEPGREGNFRWSTSNLAALVAGDPDEAIYFAPNGQNGSTGAWVRVLPSSGVVMASWAGVVAGVLSDQAAKINRLFKHVGVSTIRLPVGNIWTNRFIRVGSGQALIGVGEGRTILMALPNTVPGLDDPQNPGNNAMVYFAPISDLIQGSGHRVSDMTIDGSKVGNHYLNGVVAYMARNFVAERLTIKDISGYATWAYGPDGTHPLAYARDVCSGVFRDIWSYNANVHFEAVNSDGVLFERCNARDGDGDIECESWFHPYQSRNIKYKDCTGYGKAGAGSLVVNTVDATNTENVTFDNVTIEMTTATAAMSIAAYVNSVRNVRIINCRFRSEQYVGLNILVAGGVTVTAVIENSTIEGLQEGLKIGDNTEVTVRGGKLTALPAGAGVNTYPINFTASSKVILDGPILDGRDDPLATFPQSIGPNNVIIVNPPIVIDAKGFGLPMGVGHKISYALPVAQTADNQQYIGAVAGAKQWSFGGFAKGSYKVRLEGSYTLDRAGSTVAHLNIESSGARRISGKTQAAAIAGEIDPKTTSLSNGSTAFIGKPVDATGQSRFFTSEFLFVATDDSQESGFSAQIGPYSTQIGWGDNGILTVEPGATVSVKRVA